ncbi:hypothetical protein M0R45_035741 [Rubus argutus]|uniref:Uncharacterized protein n=1 Tax=Rubus argutus TaxID=59490 RepID=A0AAW1VYC3_RUBAR
MSSTTSPFSTAGLGSCFGFHIISSSFLQISHQSVSPSYITESTTYLPSTKHPLPKSSITKSSHPSLKPVQPLQSQSITTVAPHHTDSTMEATPQFPTCKKTHSSQSIFTVPLQSRNQPMPLPFKFPTQTGLTSLKPFTLSVQPQTPSSAVIPRPYHHTATAHRRSLFTAAIQHDAGIPSINQTRDRFSAATPHRCCA